MSVLVWSHYWLIHNIVKYNTGHPCLGLAAIFAGMLYNVQIIQKSITQNIMHVSIIERFSRNRQEEENTITFRLKCIVIA